MGVAVGWYNNLGADALVSISGLLSSHGVYDGNPGQGVNYYAMLGMGTAALQSGYLPDTVGATATLALSNILVGSGQTLFVGLDNAGVYYWDHTQLDLQVTAETVPEPSTLSLGALGIAALCWKARGRFRKK